MSTSMFQRPDPKDGKQETAATNSAAPEAQSGATEQTSQAERAAMHPERQDPEWRYYNGAWKM